MERRKNDNKLSPSLKVAAVALAFLIIGYQSSLFIHRAAVLRIESLRDHPDTVVVTVRETAADQWTAQNRESGIKAEQGSTVQTRRDTVRKEARHSPAVQQVRESSRKVETFAFNPNTVSVGDLQRLGFSRAQAEAIDAYRRKGGHFRRKSDFADSYVVADSVYRRLEGSIRIPLLDINTADSAAFDALPGIGGHFAARMVELRTRLGGYSDPEQLLDIYNFGPERYDGLSDLICCSPPGKSFDLWTLPADSLRRHPYIRTWQTARAIVLYRDNVPRDSLSVRGLQREGILKKEDADRLSRCVITPP